MEALSSLSDELGNPGVDKLLLEARRRQLDVTRRDVVSLVRRQGQRQLFKPLQPSRGKSATENYSARYQADLADLSTTPSKGYKYFLLVVNLFSREVWAEPLTAKTPAQVVVAMQKIFESLPGKPQVISTDDGPEYRGQVAAYLKQEATEHRTHVGRDDVNANAASDRAMQNIKARLARIMARRETTEWSESCRRRSLATTRPFTSPCTSLPKKFLTPRMSSS